MNTTFHDGIAKDTALLLARSPLVLRIVSDADNNIDALDQLTDAPTPHETVYVYIRVGGIRSQGHLTTRDAAGRRRGQFFSAAEYRLCPIQPPDADVRDNRRWFAWCNANKAALVAEYEGYQP